MARNQPKDQLSAWRCGTWCGARHQSDRPHRHTLQTKLRKLATELGAPTIKALGYETKEAFVQKKLYLLKSYA
jgi:hypothetical protein